MTTPRTVDEAVTAAESATAAQDAAREAVVNAAAVAELSAGAGKPVGGQAVTVDSAAGTG